MKNRITLAIVGLFLFSLTGKPGDTPEGAICPMPNAPTGLEARLLALERENGCLDMDEQEPASWPPGWDKATIAGGDIQPARVVLDPYPTLHSVVVDAERNIPSSRTGSSTR